MKNRLIFGVVLFATVLVASCKKSFLERLPVGQVPKERMFQDVEGLMVGLNGTYSLVAKYHMSDFGMLGDLRGDDVVMHPSNSVLLQPEYNYQVEIDNDASSTSVIWRSLFEALNNTNNVINAAVTLKEQFPKRQVAIDSVKGQALVLRALINFNLTQAFSQHYTYTADASHLGIPVLFETPFPGTPIKRQSIREAYAQIIKDLEESITLMTGHNNTNQVTASVEAAQAFLSRIYLYMEDWQQAEQYAEQVLQSGRFSLAANAQEYLRMYIDAAQRTGWRSPEVIWQFNLSEVSNGYINVVFSEPNLFKVSPSEKLLGLYADGDMRGDMFAQNLSGTQLFTLKYSLPEGVGSTNWPVNYKVFRLAEIYLNRAEARWHRQNYTGAEADLRVIMGRATSQRPGDVQLAYTDPAELLALIKEERRKELAFEGHRIYDITRYKENLDRGPGCSSPRCNLQYPHDLFVLPIPQIELDANPQMQQNPGY